MDESALRNQLNNLEALRSSLHSLFRFWEWMVVVGLIIDAVVILKEFWDDWEEFERDCDIERGIARPPKRPSVSLLLMALLGTGLIAFGISKELGIDSQIEDIETQIRAVNGQLFGIVSQEAGDAQAKVDTVGKKAEAIQKRLDSASAQMDDLERRVRAQGPRWLILANNKIKFVRDMKPFKDSKLTVLMCGAGVSPIEQLGTEQQLLDLLGNTPVGAKWKTEYQSWKECPSTSSSGLELVASVNADDGTKKAGAALRDELLSLGIAASLDIVPPNRARLWASGIAGFGTDSPWARILQQPDVIFLLVAPSAMVESDKPSKKPSK
jgi:hypothetical protein